MGQTHNKVNLNQQQLQSVYEETLSNEYLTHSKGFGYRKANIQSTKHHKISQFVKNDSSSCQRSQKSIMKKQFQTQTYPYSCIGLIIVSYKDRVKFGTGCLIGPNLILTTASNVYHKDSNQYPEAIRFVLNINQSEGDVYRVKKDIKIPQKYVEETTGSHTYNYAILEVEYRQSFYDQNTTRNDQNVNEYMNESCFPGLVYGYLGINTKFSGMQKIYIYGYSMQVSDKNELNFTLRGQKIDKLMCKNGSIGYKMQSSQKECGSPILIRRNEYYHIVGVHICGKKDLSTGLQIDEAMRISINNWITVKQGRMDLSGKELTSKALTLLNSKDWRNLTMLNLDNNNLVCTGLIVLTKSVWPVLRQLHVCNNGIVKLEFDPSSLINLQVLYLSKNQIKDIVIVSQLPILRVLELSDNRIQDISELIPLKYLQRLYLNGNKLTKIPPQIERWAQLKKFELSRNNLQNIPEELMKLKNLSVISLDQNASKFEKNQILLKLQSNNVEVILK